MLPLNCNTCFKGANIFCLSPDPKNQFYSAISNDSIFIYDSSDPSYPLIQTYQRSEESLRHQGPNHWIHWINQTTISFGSFTGSLFTIKFDPISKEFSSSLFSINLKGVISDIFSYQNLIGVCLIGPKLIFIDDNCKIISEISKIDCSSPIIKSPVILNDNQLAFLSENKLFLSEFEYQNDNLHLSNLLQLPNHSNISILTSKPYLQYCAFCTYDKTVYVCNSHNLTEKHEFENDDHFAIKIFTTDSNVIFMDFIDNGKSLLVIDQKGQFKIRNFVLNQTYNFTFSEISTMISSFYDFNSRRFIFLNQSSEIQCINFVSLISSFAFSSTFVYSLTRQKMVCLLPTSNVLPKEKVKMIPFDIFPIKHVSINSENVISIAGQNGLAIITDYSVFFDPSISIKSNDSGYIELPPIWINNILVVFNQYPTGTSYYYAMKLYSAELIPIGGNSVIPFDEKPIFAYSHSTKLIVTFPTKFTIFEFDSRQKVEILIENPKNNGDRKSLKIDDLSIISVTYTLNDIRMDNKVKIQRAFVLFDHEVFLQMDNNTVINIKKPTKVVWFNVNDIERNGNITPLIWVNESPQYLCCYKAGYVTILSQNSTANLRLNSLWTINSTIIDLPVDLEYNKINVEFVDFTLKLMPICSDDDKEENQYAAALVNLLEADDLKTVLSAFLDNLNHEKKLSLFHSALKQLDAATIVRLLNEMSNTYIGYLAKSDFDFCLYFPNVKPSIQSRILMHTKSDAFETILKTHKALIVDKEERFKNFVCMKCIQTLNFIRGVTFANAAEYDILKLLHEEGKTLIRYELSECLRIMKEDFMSWDEKERAEAMKVVAFAFNLIKLFNWALASFLILKDDGKVVSLLTGNMPNMMSAMKFTRDYKDDEYAKFLIDLEIGF